MHATMLDAVFSTVDIGICVVGADETVVFANDQWLRGAQRTREQVVGRSLSEAAPGAPPSLGAALHAALRGEKIVLPPDCFRDGAREAWLEVTVAPIDVDGSRCALVTVIDVTDRTRVERALSESERRYHGALDRMIEGCQLIDFDWRYRYVNDAVARQARLPMHRLLGSRLQDLFPGIESSELFHNLKHCMDTGTSRRCENEFTYPDGSRAFFDLSIQPAPEGIFVLSVDVTAHRRTEEALRSANSQQEALLNASPVPIVATDVTGNVTVWNPAAERLFGWRASEVVGRTLPNVPFDETQHHDSVRRTVLENGCIRQTSSIRVTRDGRRVAVNVHQAPLVGADGGIDGSISVLVDLTEQRALQAALSESERRFAVAFEASPIAKILVRVKDHVVIETNQACLALVGATREKVVGARFEEIAPIADPAAWGRFWDAAMSSPQLADFPLTFRLSSGELGETLATSRTIEMGSESYLLVVVQDVTARTLAERALFESDERFRQLAETIEEVFWLTDVTKQSMAYVSPAFEKIWQRSCRSLHEDPMSWLAAIHPDDRERVAEASQTRQINGTYDEEYRIVRADGSTRWIRDRAYPVRNAEGRVFRVAGLAQDITARRELEEQLRQTQKMESVGLLAGGIAHDFNNMLTVVAGNCHALREIVPDDPEAHQILRELDEAGERAAGLTQQLLAFSRQEVIEPRVLVVENVVEETEKMLRRMLGEDVLLSVTYQELGIRTKIDPGSLTQVLVNLAVNARDAMPRGGKLRIETSRTVIDEAFAYLNPHLDAGSFVRIAVIDSGSGMPAEVRARIFEPFFTTKAVGLGTGLGLSVVHGIVTRAGGHIDVESEPGVGTTFGVYLPIVEEPETTEQRSVIPGPLTGTETILVVEDEDAIRNIAMRTLQRLGYSVLQAQNGEDALDLFERHPGSIDLLLTDVVMPHMDGRELAEALHERAPAIRVIYTSGYTDDAVVRHGVKQAEVAFLPKPYGVSALQRKIREVLDRP